MRDAEGWKEGLKKEEEERKVKRNGYRKWEAKYDL